MTQTDNGTALASSFPPAALPRPTLSSAPALAGRHIALIAFGIAAAILFAGAAFVVASPYSLDEAIYLMMTDAAAHGRLSVENGHGIHPAEAINILFLRDGPLGLTPQYPSGYAFLAAPFWLVAGARGLVVLSVIGHLAAIAATYGIARRLGLDEKHGVVAAGIFGFGTFALSYAFAIWPHAIATAIVAWAALAAMTAADEVDSARARRLALASGLLIGLGTTIRLDVVLLTPAVLFWLVGARREWRLALAHPGGLLPGLALTGAMNAAKFGSWSPLSYGSAAGTTALSAYLPLFVAAAVSAMAIVLFAWSAPFRRSVKRFWPVGLIGALAALATIGPIRDVALRLASGAYVLLVDFQAYQPAGAEAPFFARTDGGYLLLIGQLKRSLLQSLPFLGAAAALFAVRRGKRNPALVFVSLASVLWVAPFALKHWHGGTPQNMRYFLPILPFLAAMTALAIHRLADAAALDRFNALRLSMFAGLAGGGCGIAMSAMMLKHDAFALDAATDGAVLLAAVLAATALAAMLGRARIGFVAARAGMALAVFAVFASGASAIVYDLAVAQAMRATNAAANRSAEAIPDNALVIAGQAYRHMPQLLRPNSTVAVPGRLFRGEGRGLIDGHLDAGRRVFVDESVSGRVLPLMEGSGVTLEPVGLEGLRLLEIKRVPG